MYIKYLFYLLNHKWLVFFECVSFGVPFLGIIHDLDKFTPKRFISYTKYYFGNSKIRPWKQHHLTKKHHWEYWNGQPIPERYKREMIADWNATGVLRNKSTRKWYSENQDRIQLNPQVRQFVEAYVYQEGD